MQLKEVELNVRKPSSNILLNYNKIRWTYSKKELSWIRLGWN